MAVIVIQVTTTGMAIITVTIMVTIIMADITRTTAVVCGRTEGRTRSALPSGGGLEADDGFVRAREP